MKNFKLIYIQNQAMYDHCTLDVSPPPLSQQKTLSQTCSLQQQLVIQIVVGGCSMICHCDSMPPRRTIIITIYCSRSFPQHYEGVSPSVCTKEVNNDIILQESPCLYTITGVTNTTTLNTSNHRYTSRNLVLVTHLHYHKAVSCIQAHQGCLFYTV